MPPIEATDSWARLLSANDLHVVTLSEDFASHGSVTILTFVLVRAVRQRQGPDRAFGVLLAASRLPQRLSREQTQRLLEIAHDLVRTYYPESTIGLAGYQALFEQDRPAAERFLLAE